MHILQGNNMAVLQVRDGSSVYRRINKDWHQLTIEVLGRPATFFGYTKTQVFDKAFDYLDAKTDTLLNQL